jgi:hypothetical protein
MGLVEATLNSKNELSFGYFKFCKMRALKTFCCVTKRKQRLGKIQRDLRRD